MEPRPIFLSGKVLLDNGEVPPDTVVIEMVCGGNVRPQAYTDKKGRFSFQVGQTMGMMPDASTQGYGGGFPNRSGGGSNSPFGNSGGMSARELSGCELRGTLAGFTSDSVLLAGRQAMDYSEVGTIVLRRMGNVEGFTFSATTALAPKDARKAYEKGVDAVKKKKWADAQKQLDQAVSLYPKYAVAWFELGTVHEAQKNPQGARKAYTEAIAADSKFTKPYVPLAQLAAAEKNWEDAAGISERLVRLDPFDTRGHFLNAVANLNMRKLDDAEKSASEAMKLDKNHRLPRLNHLMGIILAEKGDFVNAAKQLKAYLTLAPNAPDLDAVRNQLAEVEKVVAGQAGNPTPAQQ
jgi:tetratricopeptide (TPR) repeat protein